MTVERAEGIGERGGDSSDSESEGEVLKRRGQCEHISWT